MKIEATELSPDQLVCGRPGRSNSRPPTALATHAAPRHVARRCDRDGRTPESTRTKPLWLMSLVVAGSLLLAHSSSVGAEPGTKDAKEESGNQAKAGALVQNHRGDLVLIEGKSGRGSGFIALIKGRKFLVTNAHVLAGIKEPRFKLLDGASIKLSAGAGIAVGHDVVIWSVQEGGTGFPTVESVATESRVGDTVVVPGNAGGEGVVNPLEGRIVGLGPDRIEISAPIEPGSSGSPIVHLQSGKVLGVATYLSLKPAPESYQQLGATNAVVVRRFGYRLDSVRTWQPIDWKRFYGEAERVGKLKATTEEVYNAVQDLMEGYTRAPRNYESPEVRSAVENFRAELKRNESGAEQATRDFLASLCAASQSDTNGLKGAFTYDYFRRECEQEVRVRQALATALGKAL